MRPNLLRPRTAFNEVLRLHVFSQREAVLPSACPVLAESFKPLLPRDQVHDRRDHRGVTDDREDQHEC